MRPLIRSTCILHLLLCHALLGIACGAEPSPSPWEVGFRAGFSFNDPTEDFFEAEGFATYDLPHRLDLPWDLSLTPRIAGNVGILGADDEYASLASLGIGFVLTRKENPLSLNGGINPTLISRHNFGDKHLGGAFQFISHVGLQYRFSRQWSFNYRYQHMSNAGFYSSNPGLNMHLFGVALRF